MSSVKYSKNSDGIVTLTFDVQGESVNTMNAAFEVDFALAIAQLVANKESIIGVVLASAKSTFFAGGDLRALMTVTPKTAEPFFHGLQAIKKNMRMLETLGRPVVAAINGSALGGGLELALSCHYRICVDDDAVQIGFPEVTLGLLPGGGGVTKSVRLMGIQAAMPYLAEGLRINPRKALEAGYVHALVTHRDDLAAAAHVWIKTNPNARQPWDDPKYKIPGGTPSNPAVASMLSVAPAMLIEKTRGNYPAPEAIMAAAVEGAQVDFDTANRIESRYFTQLAAGQVSKNMISSLFFQMNEVKAGKSRPAGFVKNKFNKVGILGAGMMGAGIAWACASKAIACVLHDTTLEKAESGKAYSAKLLAKKVEKNRISAAQAQATLDLISPSCEANNLADCDLIIEAVFENRELKAQVTKAVEAVIKDSAVFASNTSTLPISGLAKASKRPAQFVGLHFFSPVDKMPLVEIIKGHASSDETIAKVYDFVLQIGKTPIVVNDSRGFYTSRVFGTFVNEGMALIGEGMPAAMVENAGVQIGMPVGPLAVMDEVSLKLADDVLHQELADLEAQAKRKVIPLKVAVSAPQKSHVHDDHGHDHHHDDHPVDAHKHEQAHDHGHDHAEHVHGPDCNHAHDEPDHSHDHDHGHQHKHSVKSKRMPESAVYVLEKMSHGYKRMGRAYGAGFYDYTADGKTLWSGLKTFERGAKNIPFEDAKDRMLYAQAIETVRCLEEAVLDSTRDANIGSIFGWGFPAWTGGCAQYVNHVGIQAFVQRADELAAKYGERFAVPPKLRKLSETNTAL